MFQKKRLLTLFVGLTGNWAMVYGFDFVLYPYVLYTFGTTKGWAIMTFASLVLCLLTLWFYDWSKQDWVGIEAIKGLRDGEATSRVGKLTAWMLKKSDPVVLVFLSLKFDPLITALYMRKGSNLFSGFAKRDWGIFSLSLIISNLYWGLVVLAGIDIIQWLWAHVM
ncbi:MAG: hypothetical protein WCV68_00855 [Candidatus Paceibacterota bacterium]|jgi:hypothetical protein